MQLVFSISSNRFSWPAISTDNTILDPFLTLQASRYVFESLSFFLYTSFWSSGCKPVHSDNIFFSSPAKRSSQTLQRSKLYVKTSHKQWKETKGYSENSQLPKLAWELMKISWYLDSYFTLTLMVEGFRSELGSRFWTSIPPGLISHSSILVVAIDKYSRERNKNQGLNNQNQQILFERKSECDRDFSLKKEWTAEEECEVEVWRREESINNI